MGYTGFTISLVETVLSNDNIKSVVDLGAQNNYAQPNLPAPYMSEWYAEKSIIYDAIDLNGENKSIPIDLAYQPHGVINKGKLDKLRQGKYDLLVDAGTSEHVGIDGKFDWEAIYNCWCYKFNLLKIGGWMVNENPKTGNWPGHGFNYITKNFYKQLSSHSDLSLIIDGEWPAMHNYKDGWNVYAVLRKVGNKFPSLEIFKTFEIFQQ